jgi:hypothetical protein
VLNDGDDDSCGAGKPGGRCSRCSSSAGRCSNCDNTETPRNNYAGNTHIPGIRSCCNDIRDNRSRFRLLRRRLKPERQLVLLEPEPVRLLPMEVKEVFSYILLFMNFPVVCVFAERM